MVPAMNIHYSVFEMYVYYILVLFYIITSHFLAVVILAYDIMNEETLEMTK